MKKLYFLFFTILIVSISCDREGENTDKNNDSSTLKNSSFSTTIFKATIEKDLWNAEVAFYEIENNKLIISAITDNYEKLFLTAAKNVSGKYNLDNRSYFVNSEGTFYASDGKLNFEIDKQELLSGDFSMNMINSVDSSEIKITNGIFQKLKSGKILKEENKTFAVSKIINIDATKGEVNDEIKNYEITFKSNVIVFKATDDIKNSFSIKISKSEIKSTASFYYSSDPQIDYIFADALKKRVSIFYKNGNNKTFYN